MYKENDTQAPAKDTKPVNITTRIQDNKAETERMKKNIHKESQNLTQFRAILDRFSYDICQKPHFIYREGLEKSYNFQDQIDENVKNQHQINTEMENELDELSNDASTLKTTLEEYQNKLNALEDKVGKKDQDDSKVA